MKKNNILYYLIFVGSLIVILSIVLSYFSLINKSIKCDLCKLEINYNDNAYIIGKKLEGLGIINNYYDFILVSKILSSDRLFKPGIYNLTNIFTLKDLVHRLTIADRDYIKITIPEGWTINQIAQHLSQKANIDKNLFISLCNQKSLIENFTFIKSSSLEGYLYPETYFLSHSQDEVDIIKMMVSEFKKSIDRLDFSNTNFNLHELIIFASIIQGEGKVIDEMPTIASVFYNRLNKNMYLDANATIQYIIPGKNRRLYNKDLEIDNPYNTYKYKGLPPGPINNPGLSALKSALNPEDTNYLYFVKSIDGSGRHIFSTNVKDHEKARKIYLRSLRK